MVELRMADRPAEDFDPAEEEQHEYALHTNKEALEQFLPKQKHYPGVSLVFGGHSHGSHFVFADYKHFIANTSILLEIKNPDFPEGGFDILLEAGAGCFESYKRFGVGLNNVHAIVISHNHLDHVDDLRRILLLFRPLIRSRSHKRPPISLVANPTVFKGGAGYPPLFWGPFFRQLTRPRPMHHGESTVLSNVTITAVPSHHIEETRKLSIVNSYRIDITLSQERAWSLGVMCDGPVVSHKEGTPSLLIDAVAPFSGVDALILYLGSTSHGPTVKHHDPTFDSATCLYGALEAVKWLSLQGKPPRRIILTHVGAETFLTKSQEMAQLLTLTRHKTDIEYSLERMRSALSSLNIPTKLFFPKIGKRLVLTRG